MLKSINVTKYDARKESYDQKKVLGSILRSGVKKDEVMKLLAKVEAELWARFEDLGPKEVDKLLRNVFNR